MKRHSKEAGFALLLVYLMAACVAITLYIEVPRVAFEAERQRELLLVDRGNQFKRAIQVFVTDKTNNPTRRYPASLDELENFNNHRYLRRRYLDPMTGKDEWRLIHINGGVLTDSVTTQQQKPANASGSGSSGSGSTYISEQAYMDVPAGGDGSTTGGVNRALNRRPSDASGASGDPNNPGGMGGLAGQPGGSIPGGLPPGGPGGPGANPPGMPGISGMGGLPPGGMAPTTSGTTDPSQTGQQPGGTLPGMPPGGMVGGSPFGTPGMPGVPGSGQANAQSAAAQMIGNLLTTPRPGGMPTGSPGATMGGGVAGVASNYKAEGIMVINQRTKINEWEYIFDFTKWRPPPNPIAGAVGTPQQQQQGQGLNQNNNNGPATTSNPGFGNTPTTTTGH